MGKVLKIFVSFLVIIAFGLSGIWTASMVSPGFREDVELFLHIDDENAISTLKDKNAKLEEQIANYEGRIETLKLKISDLELTVEELGIEDEFLRSEIARLQARVKELENQVKNLDGTIDGLNAQIVEMNKEVDALWNIYNNLGEYENAVNNGTSADTQLTESEKALLEEKIEELEETVEELTAEIKDLNETIKDLENQIENLESEKVEINNTKVENETTIVENTKNIDEINVSINKYYGDLELIDNSIVNNTTIINEIKAKEEAGERLTADEQTQLVELQEENANLELQKYDINKNLTECEERVATLQEEVANLKIANAEFERQIASIDNQITTLQEEVTALESEAVSVQSNINSLQDRINKFNGLIGNSIIVDNNGEVVEQPSNPVNPETPENPPVDGELTVNIQGQSVLNLSLANMQNAEEINTYLSSNENYYFEEAPETETNLFEMFPGSTNFYMMMDTTNENVMCVIVLYDSEENAKGIFNSFEANKDMILDERTELNCVAQCGSVGIIEITNIPCEHTETYIETLNQGEDENYYYYVDLTICSKCGSVISSNYYSVSKETTDNSTTTDEFGVTSTGTSIFNLPIYRMTSYDAIIGYFEGNTNYGYQDLSEDADEPKAMFKGSQNFIGVMQVGNENTQGMFIVYDSEANAKDIFSSLEANKENILGDNLTLEYAAQVKNIGYFELRYNGSTVECSHAATSQSQENYYETDTEIIYDLVTICQECGKEVSRETITEIKSTNYIAVNEEELIVALNTAKDGDTININGLISLSSPLIIDKDITINGGVIEGSPIYVKSNNVTISNVSFNGIFKQNETQDSSIYASNFSGSLNIEYCNFSTSEWESIQITPTVGASITINNCNFSSSNANQQRYIHIEGDKDNIANCLINISNNTFNNIEILDTADGTQNNGEAIGIYYCNLEQIYLADNVFNGNLSVEELKAKVCIANESPWTASESMLEGNTFNSLQEV